MENNNFKIDFVGIGAPRCATTWIYECLKEHKEIELLPKDQDDIAYFFKENPEMKDYITYFEKDATCKGDYHVYYLTSEAEIIRRIKNHNKDIKIIVSLRDPVERAFSQYEHTKFAKDKDWPSFKEAREEVPEKIIGPGFYYKHLKKYFENFPKGNILVLLFGKDIQDNPVKTVNKIHQFINIELGFTPQLAKVKINPSGFKRNPLGRIIHKKITPRLGKIPLGKKIKESSVLKKVYYGLTGNLSSEDKRRAVEQKKQSEYLKKLYHKDTQKLEKLIDRDLSHWASYNEK